MLKMDEETNKTVSFGFSRKSEKKVVAKSQISDNVDTTEETDFILSLENKRVKSTKPKDEKKEIIIPLIKTNNWKTKHAEKMQELDSQAVSEIMQDTAKQLDDWQSRGVEDSDIQIPLLMQNKVPDGFETDENFDVSLRPDGPEDTDYDEVPIEAFGLAMLKGMGWKPGQGIGKNNKNSVAPVEAVLRPKGMGLGADRKQAQDLNGAKNGKGSKKDEDSVQLTMTQGGYCLVENGPHRDLYAVIQGLDEDNARLMLKLTVSGQMVTVSQYNIKLVTKEEYKQYSKYLNKGDADRYKQKEENKKKEETNGQDEESHRHRKHHRDDLSDDEKSKSRLEKKRSKYLSQDEDKNRSHKKRKHDDDRSYSHSSSSYTEDLRSESYLWAVPKLRVRLVDKHYKKGKYYKEKVVVIDVPHKDHCVCKTEEGKVLEDISQSMMETVVPKSDLGHVYIISGKYRGQLAQVLERDRKSCKAMLQLLSDRDKVLQQDYDSICEYVGDINEEFDY